MKVTITASLQPKPNTLNLYGERNLNRELLQQVKDYEVTQLTVHVFTREGALQAAEFCARNDLEYRIGDYNEKNR